MGRVRYLTFNDTDTPGLSSACNGLWVPFGTGVTTGPGTYHPLEIPYLDLIRYIWRIKTWRVNVLFSAAYVFDDGVNRIVSSGAGSAEYTQDVLPLSERALIDNPPGINLGFVGNGDGGTFGLWHTEQFTYEDDELVPGDELADREIFFGFGGVFWGKGLDVDYIPFVNGDPPSGTNWALNGKAFPQNRAVASVLVGGADGINLDFRTNQTFGEPEFETPVALDTLELPLYIYDDDPGDDTPNTTGSRSLSITMTPIGFWPFGDINNDPIYNAFTGARIREPSS